MEEDKFYEEYEIDLREYVLLLWEQKWIIIGLFLIAVTAAALISQFMITPVYETEAIIHAPSFELINGEEFSQSDYLSFMNENELRGDVIEEFDLREENENFTVDNLRDKLTISPEDNSNLVNFKLTDSDPELAQKILTYWIDNFGDQVNSYIDDNNQEYLDNLMESVNDRESTYQESREELASFRQKNQLELLEAKLESKRRTLVGSSEGEQAGIAERVDNIEADIDRYEAQLEEIEGQLENTDQYFITKTYISEESLRVLRNAVELDNMESLTTETEHLNEQYVDLRRNKDELEQNLASSKAELDNLSNKEEDLENEIGELQDEIAEIEGEYDNLEEREEIARDNYVSAEEEYSEAEQDLSGKSYNITVVNEPVVPVSPVSPNKKLNVAIAGVLALMLGVFIVFFREFMREEEENAAENKING